MAAPPSRAVVFFFIFCSVWVALAQNSPPTPPPPPRLFSGIELTALFSLRSSLGLRARDWPRKVDPCAAWVGVRCQGGRVGVSPRFAVDGIQNLTRLAVFNASGFALPGPIPNGSAPTSPPRSPSSTFVAAPSRTPYPSPWERKGAPRALPSRESLDGELALLPQGAFQPHYSGSLCEFSIRTSPRSARKSLITCYSATRRQFPVWEHPRGAQEPRSLLELDLSNNSLSGPLPETLFPGLRLLRSLKLDHNSFSDQVPNSLWALTNLQFLDLSYNNLSGSLPEAIPNANASSRVLNMSHNSYYGYVPDGVESILRRFDLVDLSGNYFQGQAPSDPSRNASFESNCFNNNLNQRSYEDCAKFYASRGLTFPPFGPTTNTSRPDGNSGSNRRQTYILAGVFGGIGLLVILVLLLVCFWRRCGAVAAEQKEVTGSPPAAGVEAPPSAISVNISAVGDSFTLEQMLLATGNFGESNLIKRGHSGDIYQGFLEGGTPVVVKRINLEESKKETYRDNQKILVYKYMPNRDLSSSLFRKSGQEGEGLQSLDWITRLKIAIGVAEALCYFHHECSPPLVHRDIQASSILLDDKFEVRLGSLSEVCAQEGEPHQSVITRFLRKASEQGASGSASATCAYDVYCLGKVLLELVTGKLGISGSNDAATNEWLEKTLPYISINEKELVTKILDPSLVVDDDLLEEVWAMAIVARSCLNPKPSKRPLVRYILKALENPLKVVREEPSTSARLRTTSSRGSWNAALFGSWRQSSSDITSLPGPSKEGTSFKISGTVGSQGSNGEHSFSRRKPSKEIFPEPSGGGDLDMD
ncbi:unnamed protein product [Spirodela intermedia]|uniref:Protein kinase domain-containing protein n=1 Tax=Spirodela intermedia TaxID=51605 RepID=A0A7I8IIH8_SPIIN|nr:unnamed protein product [Spirodela intermedia]CAA6657614.1 unnamed protein product [Spirodela intermedia]